MISEQRIAEICANHHSKPLVGIARDIEKAAVAMCVEYCLDRVRIERKKAASTSDTLYRNVALTHADTVELIAQELRSLFKIPS